jgi:hypothetical protein
MLLVGDGYDLSQTLTTDFSATVQIRIKKKKFWEEQIAYAP